MIIVCLVCLALVCLVGCRSSSSVVGVEINSNPAKVTYYVGESLDLTGATLSVVHSDGKVDVVGIDHKMVSRFDSSTLGKKTLVVTYSADGADYTTTMIVTVVPREPVSMSIATAPTTNQFVVGQRIDLTGLVVEVTFAAAKGQPALTIERGLDSLTVADEYAKEGQTSVRVYYDNIYLDIPIEIVEKAPVGARVRLLDGFVLWQYSTLGYEGLAVDILYNDGTASPATYATVDEIGAVIVRSGALVVHATAGAGDFSCRCQGTLPVLADEPTALEVVSHPDFWEVGKPFALDKVTVKVTTAHGSLECGAASLDLSVSPALGSLPEQGDTLVSLGLGELTASYSINVGPNVVVSLAADKEELITTYRVGDTPTLTRLELYAVYADGSRLLVWKDGAPQVDGVTTQGAVKAGDTSYDVYFAGATYSFAIQVAE